MGAFLLGAFLPEALLPEAFLLGALLPGAFLLGAFLPGAFLLVSLFVVTPIWSGRGMLRDYITSIGLNIIVYFMVIGRQL